MKTITVFYRDGSSWDDAVMDDDYDVMTWLRERLTAAQLLNIVKVETVTYTELDNSQGCA